MQITRFAGDDENPLPKETVLVVPTSYAARPGILALGYERVLGHLYTSFAEGLRTNSPFYALLCFFTLAEFMVGNLQGRLRRLLKEVVIDYIDLKGALNNEDVRYVGHFAAGLSYDDLLKLTRDVRNSIAHFIMDVETVTLRPLNAEAEDQVSFYRDALKIACRDLFVKLETNVSRFYAAGASKETLVKVFEGTYWD